MIAVITVGTDFSGGREFVAAALTEQGISGFFPSRCGTAWLGLAEAFKAFIFGLFARSCYLPRFHFFHLLLAAAAVNFDFEANHGAVEGVVV